MSFIPLFFYASDVHMARSAWVDRPTLQGDSNASLEQIVNTCIAQQLPLVLGGDDVDQHRPPAEVVAMWCRQLDRMQDRQLPVYYIQGQHGLDRVSPWLSVHAWPQHLNGQMVNIGGVNIFGLDWYPRGQFQRQLTTIPPNADILLTHTVWEEYMGTNAVTDGSQRDVPYVKMILTGDFHQNRRDLVKAADGRWVTVVSNGSTCLQDCSEPLPKFFTKIGMENGQFEAVPIQLITRPRYEISIMTPEELVYFERIATQLQAVPDLPPAIAMPLVKIRYSEGVPGVYKRILELGAPVDRLFLEPVPVPVGEIVVDYNAAPLGAFDGLTNAISQLAGPNHDLAASARRLLSSPDRAAELDTMYREFVAAYKCQVS